jgi:NAD(P)-dependent dehydrogenase (short-subunit alcohol dehydrogenase family)
MTNAKTRIAIVTGSSRGIGAAVAQRLAKDEFTVVSSPAPMRAGSMGKFCVSTAESPERRSLARLFAAPHLHSC